ncbi:hypothetical protein M8C21_006540 [Ambrosia artemisiifolia]|uniref:DUF4378 domain-containing protein n=1 Tax=Ambrosia artemisiifolia TaxID=4212 RepID=A0AAD5D722_AMBAR|nr:hypothetical protein M8C21_006540 [Ambrosia artemisiifolia]
MAKRLKRQNRNRSGCMSSIVSIFSFRPHGRVTRRLLSDHTAHMNESTTGPSCPTSDVSSLTDSEEMRHGIESPKSENSDSAHTRVQELMEEEMQMDQTENISSKSFDSRETSQCHDFEDLMNKLILTHEKQNEEQKPASFERSNSLDHKRNHPTLEEPITRKNRNFFRRRSKSHECISFTDNDTPPPSNMTNGFKVHHERSVSHFSFTEMKRKLKNAIGKSSRDPGCLEKPVVDGNSGWSSPNRDHFYSERFSRIAYGLKQDTGSRLSKSDRNLTGNKEIGDMSDRVSNLYIEAKKHLHELLNNEDEDTQLIMSHSRTLGNLLSFPGYNSHSSELGRRTEPTVKESQLNELIVNESQLNMTDGDQQEPEVSDEVHQAEGVVEILKPLSPEESEVFDVVDSTEEDELSCSPVVSPSRSSPSSNRKSEEVENTSDDRTGKPSPVSVLEPLFSDDDISPARTIFRSAESSIQPLRIRFEEIVIPTKQQETCSLNHAENEESVYEYVEAVLLASDLNWDEFEQRWLSSAQILDPSLYHELQIFSSRAPHDQLLLFDTTNEILKEVCDCSLAFFPESSYRKPSIHLFPKGMDLINEVWERIEPRLNCYYPRSLDQLIKKDFEVSRTWMELHSETREIVTDVEEQIFEDIIDDIVFSLLHTVEVN